MNRHEQCNMLSNRNTTNKHAVNETEKLEHINTSSGFLNHYNIEKKEIYIEEWRKSDRSWIYM